MTAARPWAKHRGIDVDDHALDLIVAADGTWSWKDEDEFTTQTGDPLFWDADTAAGIRAEGERLLTDATRGVFPFDGSWRDFQPNPTWTPAPLPHWWDVPADRSTIWDNAFYNASAPTLHWRGVGRARRD